MAAAEKIFAGVLSVALFGLTGGNVLAQSEIASATVPADNGAYSQLLASGTAYVIRDKDYNPQQPQSGFFTTWIYNARAAAPLQVRANFCVPEKSIADAPPAQLENIDLLDSGKLLVRIDKSLAATPANVRVVQPGYYTGGSRIGPVYDGFAYWGGRPYWRSPYWGGYAYDYTPPLYHPPVSCATGSAAFDLQSEIPALTKLPEKTLAVRLQFSDGETSNWHLGADTVRELKRLIAIRTQLPRAGATGL
ncbi:hypothetical protein [Gloeobacter kilaueensis]|uniref:Uncharacterized protein n=1 Tax=Gloeobacter kilaueensis (strain ATCC BAA-2537 / CCAP 1431/1 / ULC 316 / JS1) TaxID=1183438 RepID=U5QLU7_GLOK1|nr:hypothetical protein [Gloeobacter kilaueensis]AGY59833.1 hypothetical protein GKIL_3587 [Gloeobacter kilaueensis JS1]